MSIQNGSRAIHKAANVQSPCSVMLVHTRGASGYHLRSTGVARYLRERTLATGAPSSPSDLCRRLFIGRRGRDGTEFR